MCTDQEKTLFQIREDPCPSVANQNLCRLSVVIPTLNEEEHLASTLTSVLAGTPDEVIVVDGGSRDQTVAIANAHGAVVLTAEAGRGRQMDVGARQARGEQLLFLHADTRVPVGYRVHIDRMLAETGVSGGAFAFQLDDRGWYLRWIEWITRWRSRWLALPYGDQGLFLTAETYRRSGGFAPTPIMEDVDMVRRLKRLGKLRVATANAITSARRWRARGVWRTVWEHQCCLVGYYLGVDTGRIARWRGEASQMTDF